MSTSGTNLMAGAARVDITPPLGTFINGDFFIHYATHIHDPLFAKAVVLRQDKVTIAMVVVDICVMPKDIVDVIKTVVTHRTGIPASNILISSTHTHAAGSIESVYLAAADLLYMKKLPPLIVDVIEKACNNLKPAEIGFGYVDVPEHLRCRRYYLDTSFSPLNPVTGKADQVKTNPFGKENLIKGAVNAPDPQVSFLAVKGTDGKWISVLANYCLHYVGDWPNGTISADYFGVFSEQLKSHLSAPDSFVGMMSNGTSGDINIWDFTRTGSYPTGDFEKSAFIGNDIATKVVAAIQNMEWESNPSLAVAYEDLMPTLRKPEPGTLEEAKKIVTQTHFEKVEFDDEGLKSIYAREQVLLNELPAQMPLPAQVFKIGSGMIGGLGAEIFTSTGLWLKSNAPTRKYFTIGLANANLGYLPPAEEIQRGGYETWRSRTSKLDGKAEEEVREVMLRLMRACNQ